MLGPNIVGTYGPVLMNDNLTGGHWIYTYSTSGAFTSTGVMSVAKTSGGTSVSGPTGLSMNASRYNNVYAGSYNCPQSLAMNYIVKC